VVQNSTASIKKNSNYIECRGVPLRQLSFSFHWYSSSVAAFLTATPPRCQLQLRFSADYCFQMNSPLLQKSKNVCKQTTSKA